MHKLGRMLGNIKMTTMIAALVLVSIIGSIAAVSGAIYWNLREGSIAESQVQQTTNLGVAATILERRISGSVLNWTPEGAISMRRSRSTVSEAPSAQAAASASTSGAGRRIGSTPF